MTDVKFLHIIAESLTVLSKVKSQILLSLKKVAL